MNKIIGITSVGTYEVPFLKYGLLSIYDHVDEIVVVNSGWNEDFTHCHTPLDSVTEMIEEIDVNGKIYEKQHITWDTCPNLISSREGIRALGLTAANDEAINRKADWILRFDSDQVFFDDVKNIRMLTDSSTYVQCNCVECNTNNNKIFQNPSGYQFLEYKQYWHNPLEWRIGFEGSHSDGARLYEAEYGQWFLGEGSIMHYKDQAPTRQVTTGHFRESYPLVNGKFNYDMFKNYIIRRYLLYQTDQNRLKGITKTFEEKLKIATDTANHVISTKYKLEAAIVPETIIREM